MITHGHINGGFRHVLREGNDEVKEFARDVLTGLSAERKFLPPKYFYDGEGSRLFEQICETDEYYVTRAEYDILCRNADRIASMMPSGASLVEFGSGNSKKTRLLIEALLRKNRALKYHPIDISHAALAESAHDLRLTYPALRVETMHAEYFDGIRNLAMLADAPKVILFLGSNIGNFDAREAKHFLSEIARHITAHDRLLVGVDMIKDIRVLERAYNDDAGITAKFNLNLLRRINRELDADFDIAQFRHLAFFNNAESRIEMHLESLSDQEVTIKSVGKIFPFAKGETIHTENSYKYSGESLLDLLRRSGLMLIERWASNQDYFTVNLTARSN